MPRRGLVLSAIIVLACLTALPARAAGPRSSSALAKDDQSQPKNVPAISSNASADKVDLVITPYGTALTAPAMPVIIQHGKAVVSVSALNVNSEFHYDRYFSMTNTGPNPSTAFSVGFFRVAMQQTCREAADARAAE